MYVVALLVVVVKLDQTPQFHVAVCNSGNLQHVPEFDQNLIDTGGIGSISAQTLAGIASW